MSHLFQGRSHPKTPEGCVSPSADVRETAIVSVTPIKETAIISPYDKETAIISPYKEETAITSPYQEETDIISPYREDDQADIGSEGADGKSNDQALDMHDLQVQASFCMWLDMACASRMLAWFATLQNM